MPNTAEEQINRIRKKVRTLDLMPTRHASVEWEPWKSIEMHYVPVDNFIVYYVVNDDNCMVTIVRIFYSGRDIESIVKKSVSD